MNIAIHLVKSNVRSANDVKRTVRVPSEKPDGKPDVKTVREYDMDAIETLNVQAMLVRAAAAAPAEAAAACGRSPSVRERMRPRSPARKGARGATPRPPPAASSTRYWAECAPRA